MCCCSSNPSIVSLKVCCLHHCHHLHVCWSHPVVKYFFSSYWMSHPLHKLIQENINGGLIFITVWRFVNHRYCDGWFFSCHLPYAVFKIFIFLCLFFLTLMLVWWINAISPLFLSFLFTVSSSYPLLYNTHASNHISSASLFFSQVSVDTQMSIWLAVR